MHFCSQCDNMYYIRVDGDDENRLIYYCRNCGHEDNMINKSNICVCNTVFKKGEQKYGHIINEYTKLNRYRDSQTFHVQILITCDA